MKDIVAQNRVLEIQVGSHLYGTNHATSDVDISGVFIAPINYYFGLDKVEEVDLSIISKQENGKNASDAIDRKFYEFRKFVHLAMTNSPNMIEQLFVNQENIIFVNNIGQKLLDNKHTFLHKGLKDRFIGYAISQKKKIFIKRDNMMDIEIAIDILKNLPQKSYMAEHLASLNKVSNKVFKDDGHQHIQCGDIHIQKNITVDRALDQLCERKEKFSNRKELVDKFGIDTKFCSHLIRLLLEGKELLEKGDLIFPLRERDLLLDIRNGKYTLEQIITMADDLENDINNSAVTSPLPSKPRYDEINNLTINIVKEHFGV